MDELGIIFSKVNVAIGEYPVLHQVDLEIHHEESYAIMGPTGSGKTTLLKAMAGKLFPRQGRISKVGSTEFVPSDYKFHRFVGAVYQYYQQRYHAYDSELGPTLYEVLQNQVKPLGTIDDRSVELDEPLYDDGHLMSVARNFHIHHLLQRKITSLSTGETRRSLLARSVLKNPDFLLLDKPFVGLDVESRAILSDVFESLEHISLIMVCDERDLPFFVSRRIYMNEGRIVADPVEQVKDLSMDQTLAYKINKTNVDHFKIAVSFNNARVKYGDFYALRNFSWTVKEGERWALMGPKGSGKSTVISLITGDNPQAYSNEIVLFDKRRGTGESIWDIKKKIGFVSPELQLYCENDIAVWRLVASGLFDSAGLYKELTDSELQTVFHYIHLLGIQDIAERKFTHLSTGEQRLAFLARALVKNPPLLILDEPCQGLDYSEMVHFRELLNDIVENFGKTLIYVTHYEEEIPACVNRRMDLAEGSLVSGH